MWTPDKITINVKENLEEYLQQRGKSEVKFGFTEAERHQINREMYAAEVRANAEAEELYPRSKQENVQRYLNKESELMQKYQAQVRSKYGITKEIQVQIFLESYEESWPD